MIEVKAKKEVENGELGYRMLHINALSRSKLPRQYIEGCPKLYMSGDVLELTTCNEKYNICIGEFVNKWMFEDKILPAIRKAGNRLRNINEAIKKEAEQFGDGEVINYRI